ncbi:MAG: sigma 54-interacting transcriptional regulator [Polyangiaceae bacterium]
MTAPKRNLTRPGYAAFQALPVRTYSLRVEAGPDAGQAISIAGAEPQRTLVGKSHVCALRLTDPEVSRRHAAFRVVDAGVEVVDLDSTNGTYVDGIRIGKAFVRGEESIRVGRTTLRLAPTGVRAGQAKEDRSAFGAVMGASDAMRRLYRLCDQLAAASISVIIEGETGTGKEELARALHAMGPRRDGPFVVLDCTALAPSLVESELFGHERGAFTGSTRTHIGVFERAHGGTLFIDEIGDLPLELQPKLLRAVERGELVRVGGRETIRVDARLLVATRRNLDQWVAEGRFRDDLYHRLAVARIELPPLRERRGDVRMLASHFWAGLGGDPRAVPKAALESWENEPWPGNVRELRNAVLRRYALGEPAGPESGEAESLSPSPGTAATRDADPYAAVLGLELPLADARQRVVEAFEARYIEQMLEQHHDDVDRAAAAAGIARRHFYRLRSKYAVGRR